MNTDQPMSPPKRVTIKIRKSVIVALKAKADADGRTLRRLVDNLTASGLPTQASAEHEVAAVRIDATLYLLLSGEARIRGRTTAGQLESIFGGAL